MFEQTVAADKSPLVISIPRHNAGAVFGTMTQADGKSIAKSLTASLEIVKSIKDMPNIYAFFPQYNVGDNGQYLLKPLVLNCTYRIALRRGDRVVYSDQFTLTDATPVMRVDIKLP
jgi:hypothetical protein